MAGHAFFDEIDRLAVGTLPDNQVPFGKMAPLQLGAERFDCSIGQRIDAAHFLDKGVHGAGQRREVESASGGQGFPSHLFWMKFSIS